jgi:hypothetical protein
MEPHGPGLGNTQTNAAVCSRYDAPGAEPHIVGYAAKVGVAEKRRRKSVVVVERAVQGVLCALE